MKVTFQQKSSIVFEIFDEVVGERKIVELFMGKS
jgi:hypothetical protein